MTGRKLAILTLFISAAGGFVVQHSPSRISQEVRHSDSGQSTSEFVSQSEGFGQADELSAGELYENAVGANIVKVETERGGDSAVESTTEVRPARSFRERVSRLFFWRNTGSVSAMSVGDRVTQEEIATLRAGFEQSLLAIEENLASEVFAERLPLIGTNYLQAWEEGTRAFRYVTQVRTSVVAALNLLNAADYATNEVATAINGRLSNAGFNSGSAVTVTKTDGDLRLVFTTSESFNTSGSRAQVPIASDFGIANAGLRLTGTASATVEAFPTLNFAAGVDGGGFYIDPGATFTYNMTAGISGVNITARFALLPYQLTDNSSARTTVPTSFGIQLKDPNNNGALRLSELDGDLLDATLTGATRLSFRLVSTLPAEAMLPQVGTDWKLAWEFMSDAVDPSDENETFGTTPLLSLENNRMNLHSFFNSFAARAVQQIDRTTDPLQPLIDVLTAEIPLLSDLGSSEVTVLDVVGAPEGTVAAIGGLDALLDLADLASGFTGNETTFADFGSYGFAGDLRTEPLEDLEPGLLRVKSTQVDADLRNFRTAAAEVFGLSFPLLEDERVMMELVMGRTSTLFTWHSGEIEFSEEFRQFFPVLGPVGVTLGGRVGLKTQFGFGYDTQGVLDYYADGSSDADLFLNGFFALAVDDAGNPLTGITLEAGITAGIEANIGIASAGVEGDITARIGMYLDDLLADENGRIRGATLLSTPLDELFYARGSLSAGLRAYLEVGFPPLEASFEFDSPRVTLISFDSQDEVTPVLGEYNAGTFQLVLNVGDRAPLRIHGDTDDRAEEFYISNNDGGGLLVEAFNEFNEFPTPIMIIGEGNLRGDILSVAADVNVPVNFKGGPGIDYLAGGNRDDTLEGGDGPDKLRGRGGNDTLLGGADSDHLNGGDGEDILDGGAGDDTVSWEGSMVGVTFDLRTGTFGGPAAGDTLISIERYEGTEHGDILDGSESADLKLGGLAGNDTIRGHAGTDLLEGGSGDDTLEGGADDDMLIGGAGADVLRGGAGNDIASYLGAEAPVTVSLLTGTGTRGDADGDTLESIEVLMGSSLPKDVSALVLTTGDILEGGAGPEIIYGMDGADVIRGSGGDDVLYGNHPDAVGSLRPGYDKDRIDGGAGRDQLFGNADNDELDGGDDEDMLDGGLGDDHLITFDPASVDLLDGGAGTNRLSADFSDKLVPIHFVVGTNNSFVFPDGDEVRNMQTLGRLIAGQSNDVIRLAASEEHELYNKNIDGGAGDDLIIADWRGYYPGNPPMRTQDQLAGGDGIDTVSFEQAFEGVTVSLASGAIGGSGTGIAISGFENVIGTMHVDTISGDTNDNIIMPLHGGPVDGRPDTIHGSGGMDILRVDYSNDPRINEQGISMTPNAVSGYEPIALGPNWSVGGNQMVLIYTGIERFEITGGDAPDRLYGEGVTWSGWGPDWYNDRFFGRGGNDYIEGRYGDDYLDGGEGDDTLDAGTGSDIVHGGPGNDNILFEWGSVFGSDFVDAGDGDDFVTNLRFSNVSDSTHAAASTRGRYDGGPGIDQIRADFGNMTNAFVFDEGDVTEVILPNGGYLRNFERLSGLVTGSGNDVIRSVGRYNNQIALRDGNDIIRPGLGIDQISGGTGTDIVIMDYSEGDDADTTGVTFNSTGSRHERRSISTGALLDQLSMGGFEELHLTGTSKADVIRGTGGADRLFGSGGDDDINGDNANDWIDGGPGVDVMRGNSGNDTFIVDNPLDMIVETEPQGSDTARASVDYVLPSYVDHLILTGDAVSGTGNFSANSITGNTQNNVLNGLGGNDTLHGNGGPNEIDRLIGGTGADTFVLMNGRARSYDDGSPTTPGVEGYAVIEDFTPSQNDRLRFVGSATEYHVALAPPGSPQPTGVYHDSNGNGAFDLTDELIAVIGSTNTLTRANVLDNANYVVPLAPSTVGLSAFAAVYAPTEQEVTIRFELNEPMDATVSVEIQASSNLVTWTTIAAKAGTAAWSGTASVEVVPNGAGRVNVSLRSQTTVEPMRFVRARLSDL